MKETYTVKYRQPGQWFWRRVKNVKATSATTEVSAQGVYPMFWVFHCEDDTVRYVSLNAEVQFPPERQSIIAHQMGRKIGQPIQRK